jgi:hypothetical protein
MIPDIGREGGRERKEEQELNSSEISCDKIEW